MIKAVRPGGVVLAGDARLFTNQKRRDDFRLLAQGIKNISVLTYDELLTRPTNYIGVLSEFSRRNEPGNRRSPVRLKSAKRASRQFLTQPRVFFYHVGDSWVGDGV